MEIIEPKDLKIGFDFFRFRKSKTQVPSLAWQRYLISPLNSSPQIISIECGPEQLSQLIYDLYPDLSLSELALLQKNLKQLNLKIWPQVLELFHLTPSENLDLTLTALMSTPDPFFSWVHERKLSTKDLAPLRWLQGDENFNSILIQIANVLATRQLGTQILELAAELYGAGSPLDSICYLPHETAETWCQRLKVLRFPVSSKEDEEKQRKVKEIPWPSHIEVRWQRQGDRTGLNIHFFVASQADLKKRLEGLKKVQQNLEEKPELLWTT